MSKTLIKSFPELIEAGVISSDTASKIENYFQNKKGQSQNRIIIAFAIIGSILIGLGIILIIAHNWDNLPRFTKAMLAFLPLLFGQAACGYTLLKKKNNIASIESSSIFLFISIGATIALLSQVYVLGGNLQEFILTWMLLGLPIIYIMQASTASLFYIAGITYYAVMVGYWKHDNPESYLFWGLLILILPSYYRTIKKKPDSNFITFHHWVIPISITIVLGTIANEAEDLMFSVYICIFGLFNILGNFELLKREKQWTNGYAIIGSLGTITLFFIMSFSWFWDDLSQKKLPSTQILNSPEFIALVVISLLASLILAYQYSKKIISGFSPGNYAFILFLILFILGYAHPEMSQIFINIALLIFGIYHIRQGIKTDHLGILNLGLLTITILIVCRFFDIDLSFIARGLLFILLGIGFFLTNYQILRKRKAKQESNNSSTI